MLQTYVILCLAAALGGAINSIAGGGTLLTFPALVAALGSSGAAQVLANGTSTVALVPGSIAGLLGYRREIQQERYWSMLLLVPSLAGGLVGSVMVVALPDKWFKTAVPWLILAAALLFALQPRISKWMGIGEAHARPARGTAAKAVAFQFCVAVYGGYFGAGIGILMLSALALLGMADIHRMNAIKTLLAATINGISAIVFIIHGNVHWPFALAMAVAASIGGYLAAHTARRIDKRIVRATVVAIGFTLAAYFFYLQLAANSTN